MFASACDDSTIKVWSLDGYSDSHVQFTSSKVATCIDFSEHDSYMATGHRDGKVRLWSISTRKVQCELRASSYAHVTSVCCTGLDSRYILACTKDDKIFKLDTRMPDTPVAVFEDDQFSCAGRRTRLSLSANKKYAVAASAANRVVIFDLILEEKHSVLAHNEGIVDCQWQPGRNTIAALDKKGAIITWVPNDEE